MWSSHDQSTYWIQRWNGLCGVPQSENTNLLHVWNKNTYSHCQVHITSTESKVLNLYPRGRYPTNVSSSADVEPHFNPVEKVSTVTNVGFKKFGTKLLKSNLRREGGIRENRPKCKTSRLKQPALSRLRDCYSRLATAYACAYLPGTWRIEKALYRCCFL